MPVAAAATPENPKSPAITATIKNIKAHLNILLIPTSLILVFNFSTQYNPGVTSLSSFSTEKSYNLPSALRHLC